jgi:superfamily I DNA and RNA helicase
MELCNLLKQDSQLIVHEGPYQGNLRFPYGYGAVFTRLTQKDMVETQLYGIIPPELCLTRDDIDTDNPSFLADELLSKIQNMFPIKFASREILNNEQISLIRYHLFPEVRIGATRVAEPQVYEEQVLFSLRDVKVMDLHQENLAKAIGDKHRLLRGVAGSGKTLVLACRAKYLAQLNPDWRILVLCYNVSLAQSINQMIEDIDIHTKTPIEVDNFHNWAYRTWGMRDDALIEDLLTQIKNHDAPCPQYDAILIDEGQDFEPGWLRLIYAALNPDTHSFLLVEDRAQQIYYRKALSKELGISFQGRSKILTINYRNTEEIIKLGWDFYAHFSNGHNHRHKDDIMEVIPPQSAHRHGPEPVIRRFVNFDREADFIASEIRRLHDNEGIPYSDIAVLYRVRKFRDNYVDILRSAMASQQIAYYWVSESSTSKRRFRKKDDSVKISTVDSSKGLEFKVVFVCNVDNFPLALEEDIQRDVALLYIAITRAVERLYLTYSGKSVFTEYFEGVKNAAPAADG